MGFCFFFFPSRTLAAPPFKSFIRRLSDLRAGALLRASQEHPESTEGSALRQAGWGPGGLLPPSLPRNPWRPLSRGGTRGSTPRPVPRAVGTRVPAVPWPGAKNAHGPGDAVRIYGVLLVATAQLLPRWWLLWLRPGSSLHQWRVCVPPPQ